MTSELLKQAKKVYKETRGAYFTISYSEKNDNWKLRIDSCGEFFIGDIKDVLYKYIEYVNNNRIQSNSRNSKCEKRYFL